MLLRRFAYLPAFLYVFFLFNVFTIVAGSVGVGVVLLPRRCPAPFGTDDRSMEDRRSGTGGGGPLEDGAGGGILFSFR